MTQDELDALPDVTPGFGVRRAVVDGRAVDVPVHQPDPGALFMGEDDGAVIDQNGVEWIVGWHRGERVKRRFQG